MNQNHHPKVKPNGGGTWIIAVALVVTLGLAFVLTKGKEPEKTGQQKMMESEAFKRLPESSKQVVIDASKPIDRDKQKMQMESDKARALYNAQNSSGTQGSGRALNADGTDKK